MAMAHGVGARTPAPGARAYEEYLDRLSAARLDRLNVRYLLIPQLLPVDEASELYDVLDPYAAVPVNDWLDVPATPATRLVIESYLSHSVDLPDGTLAAEFLVRDANGNELTLPLKVGEGTAEWAYDREDVRAQIAHRRPQIAFPALGVPAEEHPGYTYRAAFALPAGTRVVAVQLRLHMPEAFVRRRVRLVAPDGDEVTSRTCFARRPSRRLPQ